MALTKEQLRECGVRIKIDKRDWRVTSSFVTVASGTIGREWNARNNARKAMMEAAHKAFVIARVNGVSVRKLVDYAQVSAQMRQIWSKSLWDALNKQNFFSKMYGKCPSDKPMIQRIDPFDMRPDLIIMDDIHDDGLEPTQ